MSRFSAPELLQLGPPPGLAAEDFEVLFDGTVAMALAEFNAAGIPYTVQDLESDPLIEILESATTRDHGRRQLIDESVTQTYLGSATGAYLDRRAADYGVLRQDGESDERLRYRARMAWEALSVAGPVGAYVFHAVDAHPMIAAAAAYGPETGLVEPGEVLVVLQADTANGVPTTGQVDSVAHRLDAAEVRYATGAVVHRAVRDEQSIRPLGARVIVEACVPQPFYVEATLFVRAGPDPEVIRLQAVERLEAYLEKRRRIGVEVPRSGLIAALHVAGPDGLPIAEEVELAYPGADVVPAHNEIAQANTVAVKIEVR